MRLSRRQSEWERAPRSRVSHRFKKQESSAIDAATETLDDLCMPCVSRRCEKHSQSIPDAHPGGSGRLLTVQIHHILHTWLCYDQASMRSRREQTSARLSDRTCLQFGSRVQNMSRTTCTPKPISTTGLRIFNNAAAAALQD